MVDGEEVEDVKEFYIPVLLSAMRVEVAEAHGAFQGLRRV